MRTNRIYRMLGCALIAAVSATGLLASGAATAHAASAPSITASVSSDGNFHVDGVGFTPGRANVTVALVDFTTNTMLWWNGNVQATWSTWICWSSGCRIWWGGQIRVDGPTGLGGYPVVNLRARCNHDVRAVAKDGAYTDVTALWSNLSNNLAPPC